MKVWNGSLLYPMVDLDELSDETSGSIIADEFLIRL